MLAPFEETTEVARNRYQDAFSSSIFNPPGDEGQQRPIPAGKRRDMRTSELFGKYIGASDLRSQPNTFHPREDDRSARQIKMQFLESDILPHAPRTDSETLASARAAPPYAAGPSSHHGGHGFAASLEEDNDVKIDHNAVPVRRRHMELQSNLFDRQTPANCEIDGTPFAQQKMTPSDFNWYSAPREAQKPRDSYTSGSRAYHEKTSDLFDHKGPARPTDRELLRAAQNEKHLIDEEKRVRDGNVYYSDLFGRRTPLENPKNVTPENATTSSWHPRAPSNEEGRITINQEWSDAKTELFKDTGEPGNHATVNARERRHQEFDKVRVFTLNPSSEARLSSVPEKRDLPSILTDNSDKVHRESIESSTSQVIHQKHLMSSMMSDQFYDKASTAKEWEVAEVHLAGLPPDANDNSLKELINSKGGHIVKISVETDPVSHACKGRAKIVMRYNPRDYNINELIEQLESHNLVVLS
eukprot:GEMP01018422.1.p1 GENE.GEMP01018422.1~~GEMP01018422.1.p1  ORF type:complete len:471 (+),score=107.37 GEMP01018422.1:197-1609(+)